MNFVLAGNPNSGKTTLFNRLTGGTAHVGNWPGVTVDKKEGLYKKLPEPVTLVDLPGIYSLSPYTPEEVVSRTYILEQKPDVIINIVDVTNLERNLYLTTQLLETDRPVVVALNMSDVLAAKGDKVDAEKLSGLLGVPVVEVSALKGANLKELMDKAYEVSGKGRQPFSVISQSEIKDVYNKVLEQVKAVNGDNAVFNAVKLLENDSLVNDVFPDTASFIADKQQESGKDYEGSVADIRYKYIAANFSPVLKLTKRSGGLTTSDKIDRVLTHKIFGIPIFLGIMLSVFHIIFSTNFLFLTLFGAEEGIESLGVFLQTQLGELTGMGIEAVSGLLSDSPAWVHGLVVDGLLSGIDAVLSFLPQMLLLFLFLSIFEDSGYMARVAFIMDRLLRRFGLSGKAFMPLLMCFGCGVPGILATKALESEKERRISITIAPFFSCGAKLPIWAVFAATVFAGSGGEFVVFGMYFLGIATAILLAIIMKRTIAKGEVPPFIMELPPYHLPQLRGTLIHLWTKLKHYLQRVTTVIAGAVVVIWFLQNFSFSLQMVESGEDSILGIIGSAVSWLFAPLGFGMGENGWKFVVAAFTGLIAKEMVVATLGVFGGMDGDALLETEAGDLAGSGIALLLGTLSIPAALAFMAFNLLSVPCMAAVAAANGELGSKKYLWQTIGIWMLTAYVVAFLIYWIGTYWWTGLIAAGVIAAAYFVYRLTKSRKSV